MHQPPSCDRYNISDCGLVQSWDRSASYTVIPVGEAWYKEYKLWYSKMQIRNPTLYLLPNSAGFQSLWNGLPLLCPNQPIRSSFPFSQTLYVSCPCIQAPEPTARPSESLWKSFRFRHGRRKEIDPHLVLIYSLVSLLSTDKNKRPVHFARPPPHFF